MDDPAIAWFDWPVVAAMIGVASTLAHAWLTDRRETRHDLDVDERLRALEQRCDDFDRRFERHAQYHVQRDREPRVDPSDD